MSLFENHKSTAGIEWKVHHKSPEGKKILEGLGSA